MTAGEILGMEAPVAKIMVVDDEPNIREVVGQYLRRDGYVVVPAADGEEALRLYKRERPDLVVLDLMLPRLSGLEVCRRLLGSEDAERRVPLIMLTARGEEEDRIVGLSLGADDYVVKPFSPRELVARVGAVLRRAGEDPSGGTKERTLAFDGLEIDPNTREVTVRGAPATLTAREFDLLHHLASHPRRVFTRDQLMEAVWGYTFAAEMSTVTVHVRRLREKIEEDPAHPRYLQTVWGRLPIRRRLKKLLRTVGAALLFLAGSFGVTLLVAATLFGVPGADLPAVALLLFAVGGGVGLLALLLMWPSVLGRVGGVRGQLVGTGLIGSLLLLGMVLAGAREMFISGHDLAVLLTMLLFAALLAIGFSLYGAAPLARRIERVREGTARLANGELETELPVEGYDEISGLSRDFNRMTVALKEAAAREREMEEARRDLIAAVSHDLRTPLASARALIEAVEDGVAADPETKQRYLSSARGELMNLGGLVNDLFELAQIDSGVLRLELEEASLHDLISDTLSSFHPQAERRGVRLVGEVAGGVDPVLMNPPKLQRVLHNLVSNALRHTPADGTVTLRAEPNGKVVSVEVADTGDGIAPSDLPHVFERSYKGEKPRTRKEEGSGAGLGLVIARGLVEAHGGEISVESSPGYGSRFRFTIDRARPDERLA
jgi:DNA-binding response OmpR family regulator/signal transduction histidine kinase